MKELKNWIFPVLSIILMSVLCFRYEKITTITKGGSYSLKIGGSDIIIVIATILVLFLCFRITSQVKKHIFYHKGITLKFNYDILLLFAIGLIFIHFEFSDTINDADKSILFNYSFHIMSQTYKMLPIVAIAILVITLRAYAITKFYLKNSGDSGVRHRK